MIQTKYFLFIGLFLLTTIGFSQSSVNWVSFEEAEEKSKEEPRKTIVFFETSWCGFCKKLDREVFSDKEVASYINENYYAVRFDAESKDVVNLDNVQYGYDYDYGSRGAHEIAKDMMQGYMAYPGIVFLEEDLTSIRVLYGMQPKELFEKFLHYVDENAYQNQDWYDYSGQN